MLFCCAIIGRIISLDKNAPTIRWAIIFKDKTLKVNGQEITLHNDTFWRIHRISSKESIVSVINVEEYNEIDALTLSTTDYSFPLTHHIEAINHEDRWEREVYITPFDIRKYNPLELYSKSETTISYAIPLMTNLLTKPIYRIKTNKPYVIYKMDGENIVGRTK